MINAAKQAHEELQPQALIHTPTEFYKTFLEIIR